MNNIESIIKRIADDAQAQAQQKIDEAQAEAKQILADYEQQAKTLSQQTQERAQKEAAVIAERVESQSGLIRRNMMLQYKRQAIEQAFHRKMTSRLSCSPLPPQNISPPTPRFSSTRRTPPPSVSP